MAGGAPTVLAEQKLRGCGYAWHVFFESDRVLASLREFGMQSISLR